MKAETQTYQLWKKEEASFHFKRDDLCGIKDEVEKRGFNTALRLLETGS